MIPISRDSVVFQKLLPIAKWLNKLDVDYCNTGRHEELKVQTLVEEASSLLMPLGLIAYHQSDPRGCSLYIIDSTMNESNYSNGIPVYSDNVEDFEEPYDPDGRASEVLPGHRILSKGEVLISGDRFSVGWMQTTSSPGAEVGSSGCDCTYIRKIN